MSDETRTPADDSQTSREDAYSDSGSSPPGADDLSIPRSLDESQPLTHHPQAIAAHEPMSAYGEHVTFDTEPSPEPQSATVDAHRAMSANGNGGEVRCHQYERRLELNEEDLPHCPFPRQQLKADSEGLWRVVVTNIESEFRFVPVPKDDTAHIAEIEDFILRYEWLGSMPHRPTYYLTARTVPARGNTLVGAVVMAVPTAFSKLLGDDTKHCEALIARGAVISWAPSGLNSWFLSRAIGWLAANTPQRLFVGYGDPRANEIGQVYQSLTFFYLGQKSGAAFEFVDPERGHRIHPIGSRHPRHISMYRKYAEEAGMFWDPAWVTGDSMNWAAVPNADAAILRQKARAYQRRLVRVPLPPKHKYVFVKGATPKETRHLRKLFVQRNGALIQPYPSHEQRGALTPPSLLPVQPKAVRLSEVKRETIIWLWEQRLPLGKLALLEGDPDVSKSLVAYDLAARVSTGRAMPGETTARQARGVVILSAEDSLGDTIRPRLEAAGADLSRILAFPLGALPAIPDDLAEIERAVVSVDARLLVVDPLMAFFGERIRATNDQQVRRALTPLAEMAQRRGFAVLAIRHLTKNERAAAKYRGGGSIGLLGAARAVFLVAPHPGGSGCNVLVPVKTNLTATPPAIAYRVVPASSVARIEWLDEVDCRPEDVLTARHQTNDRALLEAMEFLRTSLASGERPATDVLREATEANLAEITLRRARKEMGVRVRREGFGKGSRLLLGLPGVQEVKS